MIRLVAVILSAVVLGTVIVYGWGASSAPARTVGMVIMLVGAAGLAGLLVRSVLGLRRARRVGRPVTDSPAAAEQVARPTSVERFAAAPEMSAATALRNSAASRRFVDSADSESGAFHRPARRP